MSTWSFLFRCVLAIALVINQAGAAYASAGMDHARLAAAPLAPAAQQPGASPCHQHDGAAVVVADQATGERDVPAPASDCCESGTCNCACLHHAPGALLVLGFVTPDIEHSDAVSPMSTGHATPALPHLIRPPIG